MLIDVLGTSILIQLTNTA